MSIDPDHKLRAAVMLIINEHQKQQVTKALKALRLRRDKNGIITNVTFEWWHDLNLLKQENKTQTHHKCLKTGKCQETEGFKGTKHEGLDMCEDGCVWFNPRKK